MMGIIEIHKVDKDIHAVNLILVKNVFHVMLHAQLVMVQMILIASFAILDIIIETLKDVNLLVLLMKS
jgi:hypothetical protein